MVLFVINCLFIIILFPMMTTLFRYRQWYVKNYKNMFVPYSIGAVFFIFIVFDYLFYRVIVTEMESVLFFFFIWLFCFIDDLYGEKTPKGLRGHISFFIRRKVMTTGLLKAVSVFVATSYYFFVHRETFTLYYFLLFIFLPHTMNLFDTKPLRVWKASILFLTYPLLAHRMPLKIIVILLIIFICWYISEAKMQAMLGDNGAMLLGSFIAYILLSLNMNTYAVVALFVAIFITIVAEQMSIQKIVERTPIIKQIDELGRMK